ncbi:hypothetical protein QCA50_006425 [Cerrena zonata]|uniref:Uncharacterized protein n=1 Tax=Cerrena zonata TaxID=2478898 RepID=A0AAW0GAB1_9APHY
MRSPDSEAPIRIALKSVDNREWTEATFAAIFCVFSTPSVRTLILGDLVLNSLSDPVLRVFLQCLSGLKVIFLIETKFNAPPEASYWGAMVFVEPREELGLPVPLSWFLSLTLIPIDFTNRRLRSHYFSRPEPDIWFHDTPPSLSFSHMIPYGSPTRAEYCI